MNVDETRKAVLREECRSIQASLGMRKYCVLYLKNGREHRSPWFSSKERTKKARQLLAAKHGKTIIYIS